MFDRVKNVLVTELGVDASEITPETGIKSNLTVSSLEFLNIILALEDEFDIVMENDELRKLVTVEDLVNYVGRLAK